MSEDIYEVKDVNCIHCGIKFEKVMTMANGRDRKLHKGQIVVCSACGQIQILGDTEWRPLTNEDIMQLRESDRRALGITTNGLRQMLDAGEEWTPYREN